MKYVLCVGVYVRVKKLVNYFGYGVRRMYG